MTDLHEQHLVRRVADIIGRAVWPAGNNGSTPSTAPEDAARDLLAAGLLVPPGSETEDRREVPETPVPDLACRLRLSLLTAQRDRLALQAGSGEVEIEQLRADVDHLRARLVEEQEAHAATRATVEQLRWSAIYHAGGRCRRCGGKEHEHQMHCRHYVGPLEHRMWLRGVNGSFGGWDYDCKCGQSARVGGLAGIEGLKPGELPPCPSASETWRGPAVDGLTADGAGTPEGSDGG